MLDIPLLDAHAVADVRLIGGFLCNLDVDLRNRCIPLPSYMYTIVDSFRWEMHMDVDVLRHAEHISQRAEGRISVMTTEQVCAPTTRS